MAEAAHQAELLEVQARIAAQRQLAAAQAQAAHRALIVAREKAANEAKSDFMSLMCHEVRTPLNGCLASAEMLLETPLQVRKCRPLLRVGTQSSFCDQKGGSRAEMSRFVRFWQVPHLAGLEVAEQPLTDCISH